MEPDRSGVRVIRPPALVVRARLLLWAWLLSAPSAAQLSPAQPVHAWECPPRGIVTDMAMSPDERSVAYAGIEPLPAGPSGETRFQEVIRLVNFRTVCRAVDPASRQAAPPRHDELPRILYDLQFSADGQMLAYADGFAAYVVHVPDLKRMWKFEIPISDHGTVIPSLALARNAPLAALIARPFRLPPPPSGPRLIKRPEFMNLLRIYDLTTGQVRADVKIGSEVRAASVALSADGARAAAMLRPAEVAADTPDFMVVDTATGRLLQAVRAGVNGPIAAAGDAVWSLDGSTDYLSRSFRLFALGDARLVRTVDPPPQRVPSGLAVSANGQFFASTLWPSHGVVPDLFAPRESFSGPAELAIWDARSGLLVGQATALAPFALKLSTSGRFLLTGTRILEFDFAPQSKNGTP